MYDIVFIIWLLIYNTLDAYIQDLVIVIKYKHLYIHFTDKLNVNSFGWT